jgi:hypothetical protein
MLLRVRELRNLILTRRGSYRFVFWLFSRYARLLSFLLTGLNAKLVMVV